MRSEHYKQAIVVQGSNAIDFQNQLNNALSGLVNPEIVIERSIPFLAYIFYNASKDVPESVLELFEILDGEYHVCEECPYFTRPSDKRMRRGSCSVKAYNPRMDERACESFYLWKTREIEEAEKIYKQIPYISE